MLLIPFNDDELKRISAESPCFAAKLAKLVAQKGKPDGKLPGGFNMSSRALEAEAAAYFATIYPGHGLQACVQLIRNWATDKGILKYSSLAGAKRLAIQLSKKDPI